MVAGKIEEPTGIHETSLRSKKKSFERPKNGILTKNTGSLTEEVDWRGTALIKRKK